MTNSKKKLIELLTGSVKNLQNLPDEILKENIYDETGHVDLEFMTSILVFMNQHVDLSLRVEKALSKLLGCDEEEPKKKNDDKVGEDWKPEEILKHCNWDGELLTLPQVQFSKKSYLEAKKWIEETGGSWNTQRQGFTWEFDANRIVSILKEGKRYKLQKEFQYFGTPDAVADRVAAKFSSLSAEMSILEPSAGRGALVRAIRRRCPDAVVDCFELMPENVQFLRQEPGTNIIGNDFAECVRSYDRIIANPPFSNNQDIDHVYRMYDHLKPDGELSVIVSQHWQIATDKKCTEFRAWLEKVGADVEDIEANAFKESGTTIATTLLFIKK